MQQWTRLKEGEARDDLGLALVVDSELFRLDAVIRWLDAAEVRLARAAAEPPRPAAAPLPGPQLCRVGGRGRGGRGGAPGAGPRRAASARRRPRPGSAASPAGGQAMSRPGPGGDSGTAVR